MYFSIPEIALGVVTTLINWLILSEIIVSELILTK